jgi:DNA-binding NarL/FixJ family response regulator
MMSGDEILGELLDGRREAAAHGVGRAPSRPLLLVVGDSDAASRRTLIDGLQTDPRFVVAAAAGDAAGVARAVRQEHPDVVLVDRDLPPTGGVDALLRLVAETPLLRFVVLSPVDDEDAALKAMRAGASGFLVKTGEPGSVTAAVAAVARGEMAVSRAMAGRLLERLRDTPEPAMGMRPVRSELTPREWEVLDLLSGGRTTEQIAEELLVTVETVRSHVKHLLRKLGVHNRSDAILAAQRLRHEAQAQR